MLMLYLPALMPGWKDLPPQAWVSPLLWGPWSQVGVSELLAQSLSRPWSPQAGSLHAPRCPPLRRLFSMSENHFCLHGFLGMDGGWGRIPLRTNSLVGWASLIPLQFAQNQLD